MALAASPAPALSPPAAPRVGDNEYVAIVIEESDSEDDDPSYVPDRREAPRRERRLVMPQWEIRRGTNPAPQWRLARRRAGRNPG